MTYADTTPLEEDFGFGRIRPLREGLRKFARWYKGVLFFMKTDLPDRPAGAFLLLPGGSFSIIGNRVFSAAHLRKE